MSGRHCRPFWLLQKFWLIAQVELQGYPRGNVIRLAGNLDQASPAVLPAVTGGRRTVTHAGGVDIICDLLRLASQSECQGVRLGEYAQTWLDSREVVGGTRKNYRISLNLYWMPHLALLPIDQITSAMLRKIAGETPWKSSTVKRSAIQRLHTMFECAVNDELITRNPVGSIELPVKAKKPVDPFTVAEADLIIGHLYQVLTSSMRVYAAYFEFALYTGMRPGEIAALRWDEVDTEGRVANVCRIVADYKIEERTKTRETRRVMLNSRALNAIEVAKGVAELRAKQSRRQHKQSPYVFPPTKNFEFIQQTSVTDKHFKAALVALKIRARRQYNCRHTYATMCLMAGMNLGFIANQLGHSVQMLLTTYARWINSSEDWSEVGKLEQSLIGTKLVQAETVPL